MQHHSDVPDPEQDEEDVDDEAEAGGTEYRRDDVVCDGNTRCTGAAPHQPAHPVAMAAAAPWQLSLGVADGGRSRAAAPRHDPSADWAPSGSGHAHAMPHAPPSMPASGPAGGAAAVGGGAGLPPPPWASLGWLGPWRPLPMADYAIGPPGATGRACFPASHWLAGQGQQAAGRWAVGSGYPVASAAAPWAALNLAPPPLPLLRHPGFGSGVRGQAGCGGGEGMHPALAGAGGGGGGGWLGWCATGPGGVMGGGGFFPAVGARGVAAASSSAAAGWPGSAGFPAVPARGRRSRRSLRLFDGWECHG